MWPLNLQTIIITEVAMRNLEKRLWSQYFTLLFEYVLGFSHTEESYLEEIISTPTNPHSRVASTRFHLRCFLRLSYKGFLSCPVGSVAHLTYSFLYKVVESIGSPVGFPTALSVFLSILAFHWICTTESTSS